MKNPLTRALSVVSLFALAATPISSGKVVEPEVKQISDYRQWQRATPSPSRIDFPSARG